MVGGLCSHRIFSGYMAHIGTNSRFLYTYLDPETLSGDLRYLDFSLIPEIFDQPYPITNENIYHFFRSHVTYHLLRQCIGPRLSLRLYFYDRRVILRATFCYLFAPRIPNTFTNCPTMETSHQLHYSCHTGSCGFQHSHVYQPTSKYK